MTKFAFIFPGQGAQKTSMGLDLYSNSKVAREVFVTADKILNKNISKICFEGPDEELKKTINAQSAILTVELACFEAFREKNNIVPSFLAGHSLGEYAALYAGGVLDLENVLLAIQKRSELMDKATLENKGLMAAVLGLDVDVIREVTDSFQEYLGIANYNEKNQTVITGEESAVLSACEILKRKGARKVVPLAVSGAFHSKLMENAAKDFSLFVEKIKINDAEIPVVTNVDAQETLKKADFKEKMPKQISSSVLWYQSIEHMTDAGVEIFIEFGPGKVLSGLNKRICTDEKIKTYNVFDMQSLEETLQALK